MTSTAGWYATTGTDTPTDSDLGPYDTCEQARAAGRAADMGVVRWLAADGYYYVDPPDAE